MLENIEGMDVTDPSFQKSIFYAKVLAKEYNTKCVTPEILTLALIISGPNIVTGILAMSQVDINSIISGLRLRIKEMVDLKGDLPDSVLEIGYDEKTMDIIKNSFVCSNEMRDPITASHHLFISVLRLSETMAGYLSSFGFFQQEFLDSIHERVIATTDSDSNFFNAPDVGPNEEYEEDEEYKRRRELRTSRPRRRKKKVPLEEYCVNLNKEAQQGKLSPVIGREAEIERVITTLKRQKKNNPLLVGYAGVGKTAIIEGVAQKIVKKETPKELWDKTIYALNMSAVVANTQYRGQFEERMKNIIKIFEENTNYIMFIDEVHTIMGAGSAQGTLDAGNIMKPQLARGTLRCIGATTDEEYKKYFRKDKALERRFQRISVSEPDEKDTLEILKGLKSGIEKFHKCFITDEALRQAVVLTGRYMVDRYFPDKAVDVIDEACAKYSFGEKKDTSYIDDKKIRAVVADQSDIPQELISCTEYEKVLLTEKRLKENVIGQDAAIDSVCKALRNAYSGVREMERPLGIFLFGGPSAVGKTYLAEQLAEAIYGKKDSLIKVNLNEFSEKFQQSKLLGSPPGYVGYGESNTFIDKVRKNPYCVILLDEVEKAHVSVMKIFLQAFISGKMFDAENRIVDFRNAVFVLTSNLGHESTISKNIGFVEEGQEKDNQKSHFVEMYKNRFGQDFINRIDEVVIFNGFDKGSLEKIAEKMMKNLTVRIAENTRNRILIEYKEDLLKTIVDLSKDEHGENANKLRRTISKHVEPVLTEAMVKDMENRYFINLYFHKKDKKIKARRKKNDSGVF